MPVPLGPIYLKKLLYHLAFGKILENLTLFKVKRCLDYSLDNRGSSCFTAQAMAHHTTAACEAGCHACMSHSPGRTMQMVPVY